MTQEEQLLKAILEELKASKKQVGFGHPPKPRYIYANRQYNDCLWYFWNGAKNEHEPIEHTALTGTIVKVEVEEKEFRGKPDNKLNIHVQADRPYVIQSGLETLFAKGAIVALSQVANFNNVTVCVEPGDTEQVLFCRVYQGSESVFSKYDDSTDFDAALAKIYRSLGVTAQPTPAPVQPTKPVVMPPVAPVVEAEDETEIEYEFTIEDEQSELIPMKSVDELTAEIKGMTINRSQFVLEEIDRNADHLDTNYGGVIARFEKHLDALNKTSKEALERCKAVGMSGKDAAAKLGGKRDDCTLAKLKAFVDSIPAPEPTDLDVSEIPF